MREERESERETVVGERENRMREKAASEREERKKRGTSEREN